VAARTEIGLASWDRAPFREALREYNRQQAVDLIMPIAARKEQNYRERGDCAR